MTTTHGRGVRIQLLGWRRGGAPPAELGRASLLPLTVRGNIHLTVLMLAEKLADAIKEAYAVAEQAEQEAEAPRGRL